MLGCDVCKKSLEDCNCPDIDERLRSAKNDPSFVFKMCKRCDRHYARCNCTSPIWTTSWDNTSLEDLKKEVNKMGLLKGER